MKNTKVNIIINFDASVYRMSSLPELLPPGFPLRSNALYRHKNLRISRFIREEDEDEDKGSSWSKSMDGKSTQLESRIRT